MNEGCEKIGAFNPDLFNIPHNIKHDHSVELLKNIEEGIDKLKKLHSIISTGHDHCMDYVVKYAELNVRYFFLAHLGDKKMLKKAFDMFIENMVMLFLTKMETKK